MTDSNNLLQAESKINSGQIIKNTLMIIGVMFMFLVSLKMMGGSFKLFGKDFAHILISTTSNPFIGLFIGLLATAIIQSSSTTTSMIVIMVATGDLTLTNAVPMLMGANIGTSVTSTIVSMGHIGKKKEFRKAISAATIHDFFNIMVVIILFPLELSFKFLSRTAEFFAGFLASSESGPEMFSPMKYTVKPVAKFIIGLTDKNPYISLILALGLLLLSLHFLTKILKKMLIGKAQAKMDSLLFEKPLKAMFWGTFLTAGVQSSSVTTSILVPLVATNKVSLRKAFPFLIGANIGTTVTALIAALSADNKFAALSVALAHVLFNVFGAIIIFPIKPLRDIPLKLSRKLGKATLKNRFVGFAYVGITFFLIPFVLILFSKNNVQIQEYSFKKTNHIENTTSYTLVVEENVEGEITRKYYEDLPSDSVQTLEKEDFKLTISQKNNTVFMGDDLYMLAKKGFCWDAEDMNGKFKVCIDNVKTNFKLNENYNVKQCFVYRKQYYEADSLNPAYSLMYLNSESNLIFQEVQYNKNGELTNEKVLNNF